MTESVNDQPSDRAALTYLLDAVALPCGAEVDPLLEQVADGLAPDLDEHQRDCVHCRAAVRELTQMWAPVAEQAALAPAAPPGLTATVMRQIRRLVSDVWYTMQSTELGTIRIAAWIVATLARDSARAVPGVRVVLGRSGHGKLPALAERASLGHRHRHTDLAVGVLGRTAVIDLAIAVSYGDSVHEVAREIQRQVIADLRETLGLQTVVVNVIVDDVVGDVGDVGDVAGVEPRVR